jgi:hypothetical protein
MSFLSDLVLSALFGSGSAYLLIRFLGKRLLLHRLSKDIEHYKAELSGKADVLKTELAIFSHEQNVAISRVDAQRAEAIREIYGCLRRIIDPVSLIYSGSPMVGGTSEQYVDYYCGNAEEAHAACGRLANRMADLAIYFDNETYKNIAEFARLAMNGIAIYLSPLRKGIAQRASAESLLRLAEDGREVLKKCYDETMSPKMKFLTQAFRAQLGVE